MKSISQAIVSQLLFSSSVESFGIRPDIYHPTTHPLPRLTTSSFSSNSCSIENRLKTEYTRLNIMMSKNTLNMATQRPERSMMPMTDGTELYVESHGNTEGQTIICHHGLCGSHRVWGQTAKQLNNLESETCCITFDALGHGSKSHAPITPASYHTDKLVNHVTDVLDQKGCDTAVGCGHSLGSLILFNFALRNPDRVDGLVLSALPNPEPGLGSVAESAKDFAEAIKKNGLEKAGAQYVWGPHSGLSPKDAELVKAGFFEHSSHGIAHILDQCLSQISTERFEEALPKFKKPVLILSGNKDKAAIDMGNKLTKYLPHSEHIILRGGHLIHLENQEKFNHNVVEFLKFI